jgi:hypothetical protein
VAVFSTKITRPRITLSPFSAESMLGFGDTTLLSIRTRILGAKDITDSPSSPLKQRYLDEKVAGRRVSGSGNIKYKGKGVRDWKLRGWTVASLKVKSASDDRCTLGPINANATLIIGFRNKYDHMWGVSPKDYEVLYAAIKAQIMRQLVFTKDGSAKIDLTSWTGRRSRAA